MSHMPEIGERDPDGNIWNGFEFVSERRMLEMKEAELAQREGDVVLSGDEAHARLAQSALTTFADPNASSADVVEGLKNFIIAQGLNMTIASGRLSVHLERAVEALRASPAATKRRFLGMPKDDKL